MFSNHVTITDSVSYTHLDVYKRQTEGNAHINGTAGRVAKPKIVLVNVMGRHPGEKYNYKYKESHT